MLGPMHSASWATDPKHFAFVLARYHFVAQMLKGRKRVLEIGCGEGTGAHIVRQNVVELYGIDIDAGILPRGEDWHLHDIVEAPFYPPFERRELWDAVYALDVLEHIAPGADEQLFFYNIRSSLDAGGAVIIGTPSAESQAYASELSKRYHVNCKTEDELRATLRTHFDNVFLFGMNDTTLHCGFGPMCHYRLAICT